MNEKDTALLSDDYGRDLASVQALQRKHEGLERDLAALEDKVQLPFPLSLQLSSMLPSTAGSSSRRGGQEATGSSPRQL